MSSKWNEKDIYPIPENWENFNEDQFNDWLFENIQYIEPILNLGEITKIERESRNSDDKRLDILASYQGEDNEEFIAIESQLTMADFSHFGRLVMYMATNSKLPKIGVWIVKDAQDSHRASIDWLNNNMLAYDFWLLSVNTIIMQGKQIGVEIVSIVEPNSIERIRQNKTKLIEQEKISKVRIRYQQFWDLFTEIELQKGLSYGKAGRKFDSWAKLSSKNNKGLGFSVANNKFHIDIVVPYDVWQQNAEQWSQELTMLTGESWDSREGGQKNKVYFIETYILNNWNYLEEEELKKEIEKALNIIEKVKDFLEKQ